MRTWMRKLSGLRSRRAGQTTAEYAIIVALVAVSSIAIILIFGDQIRALFAGEAKSLSGQTGVTVDATPAGQADTAAKGSINKF